MLAKMRSILCIVWVSLLGLQAQGLVWTGNTNARKLLRNFVRPNAPDEGSPMGAEPSGMYARKTQSPVVWLNLLKAQVPKKINTWQIMAYKDEAQQQIGIMQDVLDDNEI